MSFPLTDSGRRIAIVGAVRTPFVRSWSEYKNLGSADLGALAVSALLERTGLDPAEVDQLIFGCVAAPAQGPHVGREVIFRTSVPPSVPAVTVQLYCASSARAVIDAANEIALGHADVVIAGGAESLSENQVLFSKRFTHTLQAAQKAPSLAARLKVLSRLSLADLKPEVPGIAEPTTGKTMGASAEIMAKEMGLTREEQDCWALESHQRAAAAFSERRLGDLVSPIQVPPRYEQVVECDSTIRADTTAEKLAQLRPVFDRKYGTVTAGNSSPLTDGAAAVLVMSQEKAHALGYTPMAFLRSYGMAGIDLQKEHLLMGPTYSAPIALKRAGMKLHDIDLIEMHEAFAAQVVATVRRFESQSFAEQLGLSEPIIRQVDLDRLNPNGGSIAMGHPFGATGARIVGQAAHELNYYDHSTAFISICAAGGLGVSMVLERA